MMTSSSSSSFSSGTWKYDVFLSFRGEDTRKNFVDHLYSALEQRGIHTYKDDVTLPRGDSIGPSLMNAIQESQIAVVVFSENYADSSWCLEELEHIMKCRHERGQIVLPAFYNVDPSDVRKQKRKYEEAFSKHESSEINYQKVESWRKALLDASNIAGWETKHNANGHEAVGIKIIVGTVLDKLLSLNSNVEENLVGMGPRLQYLESQLQIGSHGVRMIGIWGLGGGGKTTLAYSVYKKIRDDFQGHCFISNELKYMSWYRYPASPLPESFQPRNLVVLDLHRTLQIELWKGDKHLPCLKELNLTYARSLVKTPNFAGLPCLQKLTLSHCYCLEEIHQSLGHHASLVYLSVSSCKNLTRFPSIFRMEKLEVLYISDCEALLEFPKIEANMDSLVNLHLKNVGIEVLPSSVGRYCTNLFFLNVEKCTKLKRIEGNFHALKRLHVAGVRKLEWLRKESCLDLECWQSNHLPPSPHSPRFLSKLNLSGCGIKDGGIPCGIDELLNLQELRLCGNHFSRLEFSLFQLSRLKLLDLNDCINLVELPELPSNLSILKARGCVSF